MRLVIYLVFVLFLSSSMSGQKAITLEYFDKLDVSGGFTIHLIPSDLPRAEIIVHKGDVSDIEMKIQGRELSLNPKMSNQVLVGFSLKVSVKLYSPALNKISASAGARIVSEELFRNKKINIDANSGARLKLVVNSEELVIDMSSGATVELEGHAISMHLNMHSGAKLNAENLVSEYVNSELSSGAKANVRCTKELRANVNSGAKLLYKGNARSISVSEDRLFGGKVMKI